MSVVDGFSHVVIHVTDLDRSEAFYRDIIGLDVIGRDLVNEVGPNALLAMNTRQRVLLVEVPEVVAIRPNSSTIHHAIDCGHVDDFPVGTVKSFVKGKFFLVRLEDGFLALSRWCTHLNGLLSWKKEHWEFCCPMHGARIDRTGVARPLARACPPLRAHPVTITDDGEVIVDPDTAIKRDGFSADQLVAAEPGTPSACKILEGA